MSELKRNVFIVLIVSIVLIAIVLLLLLEHVLNVGKYTANTANIKYNLRVFRLYPEHTLFPVPFSFTLLMSTTSTNDRV